MKKRNKQILGLLLSLTMVGSVLPATAYAAPQETETQEAAAEQSDNTETQQDVSDEQEVTADEAQPAEEQQTEEAPEEDATETQAADNGETEVAVAGGYTISVPTINFQGANAAVAQQMAKDVEIDESDPAIQSLRKALENLEIEGGEANQEDNGVATYASDIATYAPATDGSKEALTDDQINAVIGMYQQYLNQWSDNANVLGVQNPFFLDFNDDKDGLGILGEMLALDGGSVDDIRNHNYSYDDLTGMIFTFMYGDKLGIQYYGKDVESARKDALAAVDASGAKTTAQKLLVLNDWLAHNNTFDMSYIMNSGKDSDDDKPMIAEDPQPQEHADDVYQEIYNAYEPQIKQNFHDQIFAGIEADLRVQFYEKAIPQVLVKAGKTEEEANAFVEANKEAIEKDPDGFVRTNLGDEAADQLKQQADAFIKSAEEDGIEVSEGVTMTVEQLTTQQLESDEPALDLDQDGTKETSFKDAIPMYAKQAASQIAPAVINYWEGTQFGAFGMGTSVCLGYSKAYTYLVQCLDKDVYLKDANAGYDSSNWKTAKELYYGEDGKTIDINAGYTVDLVRISFESDVTMYGEEQEGFASDHYWNAVKVDGKWYYIDPCYTDVYTEVMSRDRVETDGDMNHVFFLFSDTSARKLYDGNFSTLRSLYQNSATDKTYETAWMSRAASNVYYKDGYAYYLYDSTDLFDRVNSSSMNQTASEYKLVRHELSSDDKTNGDSDYETLINFTTKDNEDDEDTYVTVLNKDDKMEKNDALTKLYSQFTNDQSQYPSLSLTAALYDGKLYFNLSNDVLAYDLADNTVAVVKEYNTVSAKRDKTVLFGGMAFTTTDEKNADFTVTNHPIAGLTVKGDKLIVSIGTNFAFISGKSDILDHSSYGYEFEETDYNQSYTNYKKYQQFMGEQKNDNDEFMWSANFVDTVDLKTLTGTSHNYETVSVPAYCGRNAFTEERCSDCGLIKDGTRVEKEGTAHEHHYIKFHEVYYTKDSNGNKNEADNYVCPECGASSTEPVKTQFSQAQSNYEKKKAIWEAAQKNAAEGHAYTPTDAKWSDDNATVTFQNLKCTSCADKIDKLDCLLSSDTNETNKANRDSIEKTLDSAVTVNAEMVSHVGTCDKGVTAIYKAAGTTDDGVKYVVYKEATSDAGEHHYTGKFTWAEDKDAETGYKVTVEDVVCSVCDDKPEADKIKVEIAKDTKNSVAATCEKEGKDVFVATATVTDADGKTVGTFTDTKEVEVKALGHKYGEPEWNWVKGDNNTYTATAKFTCENDATHVETVDAKVTEKTDGATCTEAGKITYTAKVTFGDQEYTTDKTEEVGALGHNYGDPEWKWTKDDDGNYTTAVAVFTCSRCKDEQKELATVSDPEVKAATCEEDGKKVYTATVKFSYDNKEYTDTKEVKLDKLGHKYGEPTWSEWTKDENGDWTVTATFICANDNNHKETPKVKVAKDTKDATCEKAGTITYSATVEFEGKTYENEEKKTVEGTALGHEYKAEWNWKADGENGYKATVTAKCVRGDAEYSETVDAKLDEANSKKATYSADGQNVYTAEATVKDKDGNVIGTYTDTHKDVLKQLANPFKDVKSGEWYEKPVLWALDNGITTGKNATTFGTADTCTRGEAVTFLWRAAGKPEVENKAEFSDVSDDAFYADAVAWAADQKITTGMGDGTFKPDQKCSRSDIVTFIWRMQGSPEPESTETKFTDVKSGEYYYKAVLWAVEEGITTGQSETKFAPANKCTRSEIVTFLYREFNK